MKTSRIEEMVEEFKGTVWYSRLKDFDKATDDEEENDHNTNKALQDNK